MKDLTERKAEEFNEALAKNMTQQEQKVSIYNALADFQQECPTIHKATKGYGYTYSDLPSIFKVINPILRKHALGFTQLINGTSIDTILFHTTTGETITSKTEIPQGVALKGMNDFQVLGSAVTYIRRYALSSMLGVVTDKDIDASGEQEKPATKLKTISDADFERGINKMEIGEFKKLMKGYKLTGKQEVNLKAL